MTVLSDREIYERVFQEPDPARRLTIHPFVSQKTDQLIDGPRCLSYGLTSCGYDIRLGLTAKLVIGERAQGRPIDPKHFDDALLEEMELHTDETGSYFILPAGGFMLGVALEYLGIPADLVGECIGKSTLARCGIIVVVTPGEPGWRGYLTLEIKNLTDADAKVYALEGITQIMFRRLGDPAMRPYAEDGKYQDQPPQVVPARV